ncbi:MAG: hypothetical protein AAGA56_03225, partial [Myxococcota bacterium]
AFDVACPGDSGETFTFNTLVTEKCPERRSIFPQATLETSPGIAPGNTGNGTSGYVRLVVDFPPEDTDGTVGTEPRRIEYFNCLIPAPPAPCVDGEKNNDETDVDCGGSCAATCADGQSCAVDADCSSNNCGLNGGIRQCLASG